MCCYVVTSWYWGMLFCGPAELLAIDLVLHVPGMPSGSQLTAIDAGEKNHLR